MTIEDRSGTIDIGALPVRRLGFGPMWLTGPDVVGPPPDDRP